MKKILFFFLLLLIGCQSARIAPDTNTLSPSPEATMVEYALESNNTFQFNEQCPHFCWMGINPGVTTSQDTKTILSASNQIDQTMLTTSNTEISADWYTDPMKTSESDFNITFEDGVVKTISFSDPPFRIKDITNLIGEPDKISYMVLR